MEYQREEHDTTVEQLCRRGWDRDAAEVEADILMSERIKSRSAKKDTE